MRRIGDRGHLLADLFVQPARLAVHVGGVERIAIFEVPVQRGAGTTCGRRDLVHADGRRVLAGEQGVGGVEDVVGGHFGPPGRQPVAGHQVPAWNGTDNGRRT